MFSPDPRVRVVLGLLCACQAAEVRPTPVECATDGDCPFGAICRQSACVEGCVENGDCGYFAPCIHGGCVEEEGVCNSDFFCGFGERCELDAQRCVRHPNADVLCQPCHQRPCFDQADCPADITCILHAGPGNPGYCAMCESGICAMDVLQISCTDDSECPGKSYCYHYPCSSDAACESAGVGDCSASFSPLGSPPAVFYNACSGGVCVTSRCDVGSCNEDDQRCPRGYECYRFAKTSRACTGDENCEPGQTCLPPSIEGGFSYCGCSDDGDCPDGIECISGECAVEYACRPVNGLPCESLAQ